MKSPLQGQGAFGSGGGFFSGFQKLHSIGYILVDILRLSWDHPEVAVLISLQLGVIGLILGVLGFILGIIDCPKVK
ncbi:hypothetical protein [Desulfovibrio fairfieldensis]|uniref:Uncharacterized protein n=1 Tax=Desulfovibrio fairfieldensis TaxID=44742 RepID=A0A0X8JKJ7_9BACT|nr:hypothetical protein [Desulfovibrio fairfieldensis]AMD90297.1 hypothetical protein AXF13_09270 [Desulfovibrio fairfieldensis]